MYGKPYAQPILGRWMRNGLVAVSYKIERQMRNCAGQLLTRLLISLCSGRNHRVFGQHLAQSVSSFAYVAHIENKAVRVLW